MRNIRSIFARAIFARAIFARAIAVVLMVVISIVFFQIPAAAENVDDLTILTETYPPFNFEKDGKVQGVAADLLLEMLKLLGSSKSSKDINVLPWTRAYKVAQEKKNTLLFTMVRTKEREKMFKWVGPIMAANIIVIAKKDSKIRIETLQDLKRYKIGTVRDDVGEQLLIQAGVNSRKVYSTISKQGGINLAKMLIADRIDLLAYSKIAAFWNLRELGYLPGEFKEVYSLAKSHRYFALNKDTDDAIVAQLQGALDKIRASGKFKKNLNNYLPGYTE